jgi:hypothetical protein
MKINLKLYTMKKICIITLFLLISINSFSQKCEPYRSKIDPITETKTEQWGWVIGSMYSMEKDKECKIKFLVTQNTDESNKVYAVLEIIHQVASSRMLNFDPNFDECKEYILKTENSIIKIPVLKVEKTNNNHLGIYYVNNYLIGEISLDDILKLSKENLLMFQALSSNGYSVEGKVSSKRNKKFINQMNCFLKDKT